MGEIWEAENSEGLRAAVKIMAAPLIDDSEPLARARQRFAREIELTRTLRCRATPRVIEWGETESGALYYAMELIEGMTLREIVERDGPMPQERVGHLIGQVARALSAIHASGVVHRDIKPDNIMVVPDGSGGESIRVIDFGIAFSEAEATALTIDGAIVGTPQFLAPEIHDGRLASSGDIYALGCVAYYLLTGRHAFRGESHTSILRAHLKARPLPLPRRLPATMQRIVASCMHKDAAQRPSAVDAAADFAELAGDWRGQKCAQWWWKEKEAALKEALIVEIAVARANGEPVAHNQADRWETHKEWRSYPLLAALA